MSTQRKFDDIINQFASDEEDENDSEQYDKNDNKITKHKSTSSLTENMNNKIKDILPNINENVHKEEINEKPKRDQFGYFINDDENEDSEESNSNNIKKEEENKKDSDSDSDNDSSENENKKENENMSIHEEENNSYNNIVDISKNIIYDNESQDKYDNENEIIENGENSEKKEIIQNINTNYNNNSIDKNLVEEEHVQKDEQNDLINELYNKSINHENLDSVEGEAFRMNSFRPNPIPGSPSFTRKTPDDININNFNLNSNEINNNPNNNNNNNNLTSFTETIETKIEGNLNTKNSIKINKNDLNNQIYTHNSNIISLGKMPNKENYNLSESIQKNNINTNESIKIIENNNINDIDEEKEEEAFLKREELKRLNKKEKIKNKNENKDNKDDEGKENVTEDEEENQNQKVNKLKIQENIKKCKINQNEIGNSNNLNNNKENVNEDLTDEEENHKINIINNDKNKFIKKNSNNSNKGNNIGINDIKVRDISIKLVEQYKKAGDNKRNSKNNNIIHISNKKIISSKNNNKKININIPSNKKIRFNSPPSKNNNFNNYSSDNKIIPISTINKNTSFKMNSNYNSNLSKKNVIQKNDLQSIKKNLYNRKNEIKPKYESKTSRNIDKTPQKFSFLPNIDQKSREICIKKEKRTNTPIGDLLYEKANLQKEKLEQNYIKENNNIKSNFNSKKINDKSYNLVIDRINKKIDNVIKKYSKNGKISIVGITQCLYELNIITELIKIKDNLENNNNDSLDFVELQSIIESISDRDIKKLKELEFLEQLWFIVNPSKTIYINSNILLEILKILFSSKSNIKNMTNDIENIFEKYNVKKDENEIKEDIKENIEDDDLYTSPLRNKTYNNSEIWPLEKLIKIFLDIKKNMKAYKDISYQKDNINKIIKERDKDLTFQPEFTSNSFFYKHSKYNYDKDDLNNNSNISPRNKNRDFDKVWERFMQEKELHEKTLERLREIKREKEIKMCTNVPKINKYYPDKKYKNKTMDSEENKFLKKNNSSFDIKFTKYNKKTSNETTKSNNKNNISSRNINNNNNYKLDENCTFRPALTSNNEEILNKTFSNMKNMRKPKGYNEYVNRNRSILEKKEYEKKLEEDKKYGKNYEKIQKKKVKPFNITDLNGSNKKKKKINIPIPSSSSNKSLERNNINNNEYEKNNLENEKTENIIDDVYITIDIKIPNGLLKPLKIYNKNYNDTIELVNNFCKIYTINDENKKIILKKVMQYKNTFFGGNLISDNKKDGPSFNEDLDTNPNTYSNNSNH